MNLAHILETSADTIHANGRLMVDARKQLEIEEHNLDVAKAKAILEHQGAKNQTVLNALVVFDKGVQLAEIAVIQAKADFKVAELDWQKAENEFVAARKLAGMDASEMRALSGPPSRS
jgi:hypothetical protein